MNEGEVVARGFLVARSDRAEALQTMYEHLNVISNAVELAVEPPSTVLARWVAVDDGLHSAGVHSSNDSISVVRSVSNERVPLRVCNQRLSHHRVVDLARRERDLERSSLGIDEGMELR